MVKAGGFAIVDGGIERAGRRSVAGEQGEQVMTTTGRTWLLASAMFTSALPAAASAQYGEPTPPPPQSMPGHESMASNHESAAAATPAAPAAPATAAEVMAAAARDRSQRDRR
jgi:hypothetical protein